MAPTGGIDSGRDRVDDFGRPLGIEGEHPPIVEIRAGEIHLDGWQTGGGEALGDQGELIWRVTHRRAPDRHTELGQHRCHLLEPCLDPRVLDPDSVEHPRPGRGESWERPGPAHATGATDLATAAPYGAGSATSAHSQTEPTVPEAAIRG